MRLFSVSIPLVAALLLLMALTSNCQQKQAEEKKGEAGMALTLTSTAFAEGELIPRQYTCDGKDISPPLAWSGAPEATKSFALIGDDPDAPMGTWVHWVLYNLPPATKELPEQMPVTDTLSGAARQGVSDFGSSGYGGPCPPSGTHRYFFKLYALDTTLELGARPTKADVERAMKGHILAQSQLMGKYKRQK